MILFSKETEQQIWDICVEDMDKKARWRLGNYMAHDMIPIAKLNNGSVLLNRKDYIANNELLLIPVNGMESVVKQDEYCFEKENS